MDVMGRSYLLTTSVRERVNIFLTYPPRRKKLTQEMEMFKIVLTDIKTWDDTWPRANMTNWISLEMPDSNQSKVCLLSKLSCPANWYFPSVRRLIISLTQRSEVLWRKSVPFESISSTLNLGASCPLGNDGKLSVYRYHVRFVRYQI